jgi:hypothetical protein
MGRLRVEDVATTENRSNPMSTPTARTFFALALCALPVLAAPLQLYVSPAGSDEADGTRPRRSWFRAGGPFRTLSRARDEIRRQRQAGTLPAEGAVVSVRGGVYELPETFALSKEDSGTVAGPIVYRPYRSEKARLLGGRLVTAFAPVPEERLARIPEEARPHVVQVDLKAMGLTDIGEPTTGGIEVFFNGKPLSWSRYPNEGFIKVTGISDRDTKESHGRKGSKYGEIWFDDARGKRWAGESDLWTHGYWFWDWSDQRHKVVEFDPEAGRMLFQEPFHGYGYRKGAWFYVYNCLSEIDQPGEWQLDTKTGILTLWPPSDPTKAEVVVSVLPTVVEMKDVENVTLHGFVMEGARGTTLQASNVADVRVETCTIRNGGGGGISLSGKESQVVGCDLYNLGSHGIGLTGGDRKTLTKGNLLAENNHIHHYARVNRVYRPGISLQGVGNVARRNLIHDAPHMAMGFGGNDHLIELNEIHSACYESNDAGAIYTGRDWAQRGTVLRNNYLHDISGFEGKGCMGIYLDDMFSGTTIEGNLFVNVTRAAFMGGGRDNVVDGNIFVDCRPAVHVDARGVGWAKGAVPGVMTERLKNSPYNTELWKQRWPELQTVLADEPGLPKGTRITRNISIGGRWSNIEGKARPCVTMENNLVDEDAGFVNAERGDYRLREDAPAHAIGIQPIPYEKIGLYKDALRATWPVKHPVRPTETPAAAEFRKKGTGPTFAVQSVKKGSIQVDGKGTDWSADPKQAMVCAVPPCGEASEYKSLAWAACDGEALYLLVKTPVDPAKPLKTGDTWGQEDAVEIAFRDLSAKKTPVFNLRGFAGGQSGSVCDAGASPKQADAVGKEMTYAATQAADHWIGEWRIPLAACGIKPDATRLAFNINVRRMADNTWMVWQTTGGPVWDVDYAGILLLK